MNRRTVLFSLLAALATATAATATAASPATVTVTYDHPERFAETREVRALAPTRASDDYLTPLKTYIERRAGKVLAPGER